MLFNSYIFIFLFLPIVLLGFYWIGLTKSNRIAAAWLVASSLFFYGWWNPAYLILIIGSILFNYSLSTVMLTKVDRPQKKTITNLWNYN